MKKEKYVKENYYLYVINTSKGHTLKLLKIKQSKQTES